MKYVLFIALLMSAAFAADDPDTMTTHTWMESTCPTASATPGVPPDPVPPPGNSGDWKKIWTAWGGGVWDTLYHRLELVGGGHADYGGNEIQSFSPDSCWQRLSEPTDSSKINHSSSIYSTGYYAVSATDSLTPDYHAPRARHTYTDIQSVDGKLYMVYCPGCYPSANDASTSDVYDFTTAQWDTLGAPYDPGSPSATANGGRGVTGVDSLGNIWWVTGGDNSVLSWLNRATGKWTTIGSFWDGLSVPSGMNCASIPYLNRMYCFGGGAHGYVDFDTTATAATMTTYATTGATGIQSAVAPGITYDSRDSLILGWSSGDTVYALSLATAVWTAIAPANAVTPTAPQAQGTYGRFRYMPEWNAVVLSNSADDAVYYWKPSAGAGTGIGGGGGGGAYAGTYRTLTGAGGR